ncbi:MAG TPA: SirB2 family protein [Burkholderiales bacterium]|nr:SirB2 family protein [Burkholderiales bacterium]
MTYWMLKSLHVGAVTASLCLFLLRGAWMMRAPQRLGARWVRVVPHVVDTVLLASAVALAALTAQYPFVHSWLTAKVIALLVYIALGSVALKRGPTRGIRVAAWIGALVVFAYIVAVARTRSPVPWPP